MPDFDEEQHATPQRKSIATVQMAITFGEINENWAIEGGTTAEAGPHPIRIVISNENSVSCHFLNFDETEGLIAKLSDVLRRARLGLIVPGELPEPGPNGHR
jgi:hypothetical protein